MNARFAANTSKSLPKPAFTWRRVYWAYAAVLPLGLYAFEAAKVSLYHVARAENVGLFVQLVVMLGFFALATFVPRFCWAVASSRMAGTSVDWVALLIRLAVLGVVLASVHLLLLTFILIAMHATAAWAREPTHILHAYGEAWLSYFGVWLITYALIAAAIVYVLYARRPKAAAIARFEVRHNGQSLSLALNEIFWIKAIGNYAEIHSGRGVFVVRQTLAQIYEELGASGFLKAHRSALVNGAHVKSIRREAEGSSYAVLLGNDEEAPLSRRNMAEFKRLLKTVERGDAAPAVHG